MEWFKKMWAKKLELLQSRRFWQVTLIAVLEILELEAGWSPELIKIVQLWLGTITVIGTFDKLPKAIKK